jgi:hypothetical protein
MKVAIATLPVSEIDIEDRGERARDTGDGRDIIAENRAALVHHDLVTRPDR